MAVLLRRRVHPDRFGLGLQLDKRVNLAVFQRLSQPGLGSLASRDDVPTGIGEPSEAGGIIRQVRQFDTAHAAVPPYPGARRPLSPAQTGFAWMHTWHPAQTPIRFSSVSWPPRERGRR